jgi:hypothetical protein
MKAKRTLSNEEKKKYRINTKAKNNIREGRTGKEVKDQRKENIVWRKKRKYNLERKATLIPGRSKENRKAEEYRRKQSKANTKATEQINYIDG